MHTRFLFSENFEGSANAKSCCNIALVIKQKGARQPTACSFGWCWFVLREKYCWLIAGGRFVLREKYCWLVADKPNEQAANL
jgi:hypothetical protein